MGEMELDAARMGGDLVGEPAFRDVRPQYVGRRPDLPTRRSPHRGRTPPAMNDPPRPDQICAADQARYRAPLGPGPTGGANLRKGSSVAGFRHDTACAEHIIGEHALGLSVRAVDGEHLSREFLGTCGVAALIAATTWSSSSSIDAPRSGSLPTALTAVSCHLARAVTTFRAISSRWTSHVPQHPPQMSMCGC